MSKAENLINGLHKLTHKGELNMQGLVALGPDLGIHRKNIGHGIYFEVNPESDASYFDRIHRALRRADVVPKFGEYYETLSVGQRRAIGRTINEVRIR